MDLNNFKLLHKKFSKSSLPKEVWQSAEYEEYINAIDKSEDCSNWYLTQKLKKRKFDFSTYCCLTMASHIAAGTGKRGKLIYNDVDVIMRKFEDGTFGIPVHDGGSSIIKINFCPWCGKKLNL